MNNNSANNSKPKDNKYSTIKQGTTATSTQSAEADDRPVRNSLGTVDEIDCIQEDIKEEDPDFNGLP